MKKIVAALGLLSVVACSAKEQGASSVKMGPGGPLELPKSYDYTVAVTNSTAAEIWLRLQSPYDNYCQKSSYPETTLAAQASGLVKANYKGCVNGGGSAVNLDYIIKDAASQEIIARGTVRDEALKDGAKVICKDTSCELVK